MLFGLKISSMLAGMMGIEDAACDADIESVSVTGKGQIVDLYFSSSILVDAFEGS